MIEYIPFIILMLPILLCVWIMGFICLCVLNFVDGEDVEPLSNLAWPLFLVSNLG